MPQSLKTALKLFVSLGLTAGFLWAAFRSVELSLLWQTIQKANPYWLAGGVLFFVLAIPPRAWRWQILLGPVGPKVSFWRANLAILTGYAANNVFPRAGEIARGVALQRDESLPLSAILATVLVERVIDMLALLILFGAVLFIVREKISRAFPWMENLALLALFATIVLLILFALLSAYGDRALHLIHKTVSRLSQTLADRLVDIFRSLFQGLGAVRTTSGYLGIFLSSILLNLTYILATYITFFSFNFPELYGLGFLDAMVVLVISTIGIIIPTPGGTGTYHYFASQTLHQIYHIPLAESLAFATMLHGLAFITYLILGAPGLLRLLFTSGLSAPPEKTDTGSTSGSPSK